MQRFAAVTRVRPEKLEQYKELHAKPWAGVLETIKKAGIRNTLLEQAALPFVDHCAAHGIGVIIGGVYNSGLLAHPHAGAHYDYAPVPATLLTRALALQDLCLQHGVPLRAAALQFPLRHPAVASVLVAARTSAQLEDNLRMFEMLIPDGLWAALQLETDGITSSLEAV